MDAFHKAYNHKKHHEEDEKAINVHNMDYLFMDN